MQLPQPAPVADNARPFPLPLYDIDEILASLSLNDPPDDPPKPPSSRPNIRGAPSTPAKRKTTTVPANLSSPSLYRYETPAETGLTPDWYVISLFAEVLLFTIF
jgi:hypothetical protein